MNLWLDDIRPAPIGWTHVKTVDDAKALLLQGGVVRASLDHDLGACEPCMDKWRNGPSDGLMPNCEHFGTGYTLCVWMAEHNVWPHERPTVHSANPVGRDRMRGVIARYFPA